MALVLSRFAHESVIAFLPDGREIKITVGEVQGQKVRLAISAPEDVKIFREEVAVVYRADRAAKALRSAAQVGGG
jgi:carbon storage regulator CsrA